MATVTNEHVECNENELPKILDELRAIYPVLEKSHQELSTLFGEGQKDEEQLVEAGVIPQIQDLVSRTGRLSRKILDEVIRVRNKLG